MQPSRRGASYAICSPGYSPTNREGRTQPLLGLMGWKGSSGWGSPACVEQYRSSFWYHSARGQWVTSWHTLNERRSGLQVFRVQSATSCLEGYQPTITPDSRALGGVEGPPGPPNNAHGGSKTWPINEGQWGGVGAQTTNGRTTAQFWGRSWGRKTGFRRRHGINKSAPSSQ